MIDFYKNLDTLNLIFFWGIVIVVLLLVVFLILILFKKKNKKINISIDDNEEIPIKTNLETNVESTQGNFNELKYTIQESNEDDNYDNIESSRDNKITEEIFNASEYIQEMSFNENKIKNEKENLKVISNANKNSNFYDNVNSSRKPYEKNVLREMSLNQTSPIGIVKQENVEVAIEKNEEHDLTESLNAYNNNSLKEKNTSYLKEVSDKLSNAVSKDKINRTEYEIQQEEEAIISYEELMQKKDSIKIVDEEEAIISIDELIKRNKNDEKLYNITSSEEDTNFIKELKKFRNDL